VLDDERARRAAAFLPHSAVPATVALPTAGEMTEDELRAVMRLLLEARREVGGGAPAAGSFCSTALDALQSARMDRRDQLARLERDFYGPPEADRGAVMPD
jgi:hypothetical protein